MFRSLSRAFAFQSAPATTQATASKVRRQFRPALEPLETRVQPSATLVRDIYPGSPGSAPTELVDRRGTLFFAADNGIQGRELWMRTAGGQVRLVRDINPGPEDSNPQNLTVARGILFFSADDGVHGRELWRSDGTAAGTFMVRDINPGPNGSDPTELVNYRRTVDRPPLLYFAADDGVHGRELWRSAGTASSTRLVRDINPGPEDSSPTYLTPGPLRNRTSRLLFFRADDGFLGAELWRSNGTLAGTRIVRDIRPGAEGSNPFNLTRVNFTATVGAVFFGADDGVRGAELWRSNGAPAGTDIVRDINLGPASSLEESPTALMANFQGRLFFAADDGVLGRELWRSNGSAVGTTLVRDINPGPGSSNPTMQEHRLQNRRYLVLNGVLFFGADDGFFGGELWRTNGQTAGTFRVKDINPGPAGSLLDNQLIGIVHAGQIYFAASDGAGLHDTELWRSNGTEAGTQLDDDINVGFDPSNPAWFERSAGDLFFAANDGLFGRELWQLL